MTIVWLRRLLPMNGVHVKTAVKLARRWAYDVKGVKGDAVVIMAENNLWGEDCSFVVLGPDVQGGRPCSGVRLVPYEDLKALEASLKKHGRTWPR